jgi:hypothetical protein
MSARAGHSDHQQSADSPLDSNCRQKLNRTRYVGLFHQDYYFGVHHRAGRRFDAGAS